MNAVSYIGSEPSRLSDFACIGAFDRVILPGVGSFARFMLGIKELGGEVPIRDYVAGGGSLLGICLGMQVLFSNGTEGSSGLFIPGLDIIPGCVVELPHMSLREGTPVRVPHVGWRGVTPVRPLPSPDDFSSSFYFVHSYTCRPSDEVFTTETFEYGGHTLVAAVQSGTVRGVQYHPEKSGEAGLALLAEFCNS
jgi:glutamine amidotransferase